MSSRPLHPARGILPVLLPALLVASARGAETTAPVDTSPLPVAAVPAFPDLEWSGWQAEVEGQPHPLRPILLTHAGDGSGRLFVPEQQGRIHVFRRDSARTKVFLDLSAKVRYDDRENEEGFLGMAFHPRFRENGEFFVHYTAADSPHTMVLERYRVSEEDPDAADPDSGEEILRVRHPYWNHKGGTICFGPDGYLYITYGDGGMGDDPHGNGQNLQTLLGKILRIDVDRRGEKTAYSIPADNPFAADGTPRPKGVRREIWAYGLRNVWRMSFDRKTGRLWIADVGQDRWEEINVGRAGANYGWNLREGDQPYAPASTATGPGFDDPVWAYPHDVGKSITGGNVYRGEALPDLDGWYFYADFVAGRLWGLKYDEAAGRVVANGEIPLDKEGLAILSFGEDERGEIYFCVLSADGRGIYTLARRDAGAE